MAAAEHPGTPPPRKGGAGEANQPSHNFDAQKEIHRRIRNDPDYDDWEYGTEPLPLEAWVEKDPSAASPASAASAEGAAGT
jgi:hypothetical protein